MLPMHSGLEPNLNRFCPNKMENFSFKIVLNGQLNAATGKLLTHDVSNTPNKRVMHALFVIIFCTVPNWEHTVTAPCDGPP